MTDPQVPQRVTACDVWRMMRGYLLANGWKQCTGSAGGGWYWHQDRQEAADIFDAVETQFVTEDFHVEELT